MNKKLTYEEENAELLFWEEYLKKNRNKHIDRAEQELKNYLWELTRTRSRGECCPPILERDLARLSDLSELIDGISENISDIFSGWYGK